MGNENSTKKTISGDVCSPSFKEDVGGVLFDKVITLREENADKITGMLLEMPARDLQIALNDDSVLKRLIDESVKSLAIKAVKQNITDREAALGDIVYQYVETVYTEEGMAEKITGMLLEMESEVVENLLQNEQDLLGKIHEAAAVLMRDEDVEKIGSHAAQSPTKEELGEKIFGIIMQWHPDEEQAAKLTGMILEMEEEDIVGIARDEKLLKCRVDEARNVLRIQK